MAKAPKADVLLPAHQALDVLWRDHLHRLLDRHIRDIHSPKLITHFLVNGKAESLVSAFRRAKEALLVNGPGSHPSDENSVQRQVYLDLCALERFILDWSYGRVKVDAAELRRQREGFHRARDMLGSVRFVLSSEQFSAAMSGDAPQQAEANRAHGSSKLPKEALAVALLVAHPDWTDVQIAAEVPCHPKSLYKMQRYVAARKVIRGSPPAGTKDGETGDVEAFEDE